jgi:hypothetical protein
MPLLKALFENDPVGEIPAAPKSYKSSSSSSSSNEADTGEFDDAIPEEADVVVAVEERGFVERPTDPPMKRSSLP